MLIEENMLYTKEDLLQMLGFQKPTADKIFKEARVYKYPNKYCILGKNLIAYIDQESTDKPR